VDVWQAVHEEDTLSIAKQPEQANSCGLDIVRGNGGVFRPSLEQVPCVVALFAIKCALPKPFPIMLTNVRVVLTSTTYSNAAVSTFPRYEYAYYRPTIVRQTVQINE
jgi:hypothetical protein